MKRFLAFFTSLSLLIMIIPSALIWSAEAAEWDFYTLQSYDEEKAPHISDSKMFAFGSSGFIENRSFDEAFAPKGSPRSLKLSVPAEVTQNMYFVNLRNEERHSAASGVRVWIANPAANEISLHWQHLDSAGSKTSYLLAKRPYYLQYEDKSEIYSYDAVASTVLPSAQNSGDIILPANFRGWLYVPYASGSQGNNAGAIASYSKVRFYLAGGETGSTVYLNRFQYYTSSVTVSDIRDYNFDTVVSVKLSEFLQSPSAASRTVALTTDICDGESGSALKIKANYTNSSESYGTLANLLFFNMASLLADDTADGLRFWVSNPENTPLILALMFNNYENATKNYPIYLQEENGDPYLTQTRSSLHDGGARAAISVPAGFTGYVYLPYTVSSLSKTGHLILVANVTSEQQERTFYLDSFGTYLTEDFDALTLTDFNSASSLDGFMWGHTADSNSLTDLVSQSGKAVKCNYTAGANASHRFYNLENRTNSDTVRKDAANYAGFKGYRIWLSNPAETETVIQLQFRNYKRCFVGSGYYLKNDDGTVTGHQFKGKNSNDTEVGCITLPADFSGYVCIPFGSVDTVSQNPINMTQAADWRCVLAVINPKVSGAVYYDSFGMYNTLEIPESGDINSDGTIDIRDLVRLKKYSAGMECFVNELGTDVNSDGKFADSADLVCLRQILLGR